MALSVQTNPLYHGSGNSSRLPTALNLTLASSRLSLGAGSSRAFLRIAAESLIWAIVVTLDSRYGAEDPYQNGIPNMAIRVVLSLVPRETS